MMRALEPMDHAWIRKAVYDTFKSAGIPVPTGTTSIVPLRRLVAAYPLLVDEVNDLCSRIAAAYMQARAGREMVQQAQADNELAGFLYANAAGGWILVKQGDYLPRRRFTIAHELGHYILHFLPMLEHHVASHHDRRLDLSESLPPSGEGKTSDETGTGSLVIHSIQDSQPDIHDSQQQLEQQADLFAAELLMPEDQCKALRDQFAPRYGTRIDVLARRLASEMLVSEAAMKRRLVELQVA